MPSPNTLPWTMAEHAAMEWEQIPQTMSAAGFALAAVIIGNRLWIFGGHSSSGYLSSSEMFDFYAKKWTSLAPMPTARAHVAAVTVGNQAFVIGGRNVSGRLSTMEMMNVKKRQWTSCPSMSTPREGPAAVAIGKHIIVMGGFNDSGSLKTVEMYDTDTREWTDLPPMSTDRCYVSAAVVDDNVYVFGGCGGGGGDTAEMYSTATKQWTALPPIPFDHKYGAAVSIGKIIILVGGFHDNKGANMFDTELKIWHTLPQMKTNHSYCAAAMIENQVIVAGGHGSNIVERLELPKHFGALAPPDIPDLPLVRGREERVAALQEWLVTTAAMKDEYLEKRSKATQKIQTSASNKLDELEEQLQALLFEKERANKQKQKLLDSLKSDTDEFIKAINYNIANARGVFAGCASSNLPPARADKEIESAAACGRAKKDEVPPAHLVCPITKQVMKDSVSAADGHKYERTAIEQHIAQVPDGQDVLSPVTGDVLPYLSLIPIFSQEQIRSYNLEKQNEEQG